MRIPQSADHDTQNAFRDIEQELADLKAALRGLQVTSDGGEVAALKDRLDTAPSMHDLSSDKNVFVAAGTQHAAGLVPAPANTALGETLGDSGWVVPNLSKLAQAAQTPPGPHEIYNVPGALHVAGPMQSGMITAGDLYVHGTHNITAAASAVTGCRLQPSSAQSLTQNVWTTIDWQTEVWDSGGCHDAGAVPRITVPTGKGGIWLVTANIYTTATAEIFVRMYPATAGGQVETHSTAAGGRVSLTQIWNVNAADYFLVDVYATAAGQTVYDPASFFSAVYLGTAS